MIWSLIYESGPALITPFSSATWKMCLSRARWHLLDMFPFILLLVGIYHLFRGEDRNWGTGHRFDGLMIWLGFPLNLLMHILCRSIHHIISQLISWHWLNTLLLVQCMVVYCMLNDTQVVTQMSFTPEHKHCWFSGRILACHAGDRGSIPRQCTGLGDIFKFIRRWNQQTLRVGFEPTREDPIWFRVKRLNHSAIAAKEIWHIRYGSCWTTKRGNLLRK